MLLGINNTSSRSWLQLYRGQWGISFPLLFDDGSRLFSLYQVGPGFGNIPPTYVVIDTKGIVRFRTDDRFNQTEALQKLIGELLPR